MSNEQPVFIDLTEAFCQSSLDGIKASTCGLTLDIHADPIERMSDATIAAGNYEQATTIVYTKSNKFYKVKETRDEVKKKIQDALNA